MKRCWPVLFFFLCGVLSAQPYMEGRTRHRFAQLNLGADARMYTNKKAGSFQLDSAGFPHAVKLDPARELRFVIGGTHFWGHADFYISVPIVSSRSNFGSGVETGMKIFPWRITSGRLRPYIGASGLFTYFIQGDGALALRLKGPVTGGFVFSYRNHMLEIGGGWMLHDHLSYYVSPTISRSLRMPGAWVSAGYRYMIETTLGAEKSWQSGRTKKLTDTLSEMGKLDGLTLSAGPSSAFL